MRRFQNEFKCNNKDCENWVPHLVLIAETEEEYKQVKAQIPMPHATLPNGNVIKQHDCEAQVAGVPCTGKVNTIYLKRDFPTTTSK